MNTPTMTLVPAAGGSVQHVLGCTHLTKITHAATGAFSVLVLDVPVGCGPPLHYHEKDAEWAYVLAGQITFENEDGPLVAGPGDSVFLPAGRAHGFSNQGSEAARMLIVITPGVKAHEFFTEIDSVLHGALAPPVMVEIASRYGIHFGVPAAPQAA